MKRAAVVTLLAVASLSVTPPAPADDGLLGGLLGGTPGSTSTGTAAEQQTATAKTFAPDRRLRRGCHTYWFGYEVTSPTSDWTLETSVIDPNGKAIAAHAFISDIDATTGKGKYTLCKRTTRPGRFKIKGLLSWYEDPDTPNEVRIPTSYFRLRRPA